MNPELWNPDWGYTFVYADYLAMKKARSGKIIGVLTSCPYCGHQWVYKGGNKHTATCHGRVKEDGYDYICDRKVRLHPYLLNLKEKDDDPFGRLRHNRGRTSRSKLKYPNKNYEHVSEVGTK